MRDTRGLREALTGSLPLPSFVVEQIFDERLSDRALREILQERRLAPRAFHSALRRDFASRLRRSARGCFGSDAPPLR